MKIGLTNPYIWSLAIDPKNTSVIYAGTKHGGVFKSINGGRVGVKCRKELNLNYIFSYN